MHTHTHTAYPPAHPRACRCSPGTCRTRPPQSAARGSGPARAHPPAAGAEQKWDRKGRQYKQGQGRRKAEKSQHFGEEGQALAGTWWWQQHSHMRLEGFAGKLAVWGFCLCCWSAAGSCQASEPFIHWCSGPTVPCPAPRCPCPPTHPLHAAGRAHNDVRALVLVLQLLPLLLDGQATKEVAHAHVLQAAGGGWGGGRQAGGGWGEVRVSLQLHS